MIFLGRGAPGEQGAREAAGRDHQLWQTVFRPDIAQVALAAVGERWTPRVDQGLGPGTPRVLRAMPLRYGRR